MAEQLPKRRRGCAYYGCVASAVLMLVLLVAVLAGLHYARKLVNEFTDTQPMPLPTVQMTAAQIEAVRQRVAAFRSEVNAGQAVSPLALTGEEINGLIAQDPEYQGARGKVYVTIAGGELKGQLSVPLDPGGRSALKDRYFNGTATLGLSLQDGRLRVTSQQVTVKGKLLPEWAMRKLRQQDLARDLNADPRASAELKQLQDIQIKDGKMILLPKESK